MTKNKLKIIKSMQNGLVALQ